MRLEDLGLIGNCQCSALVNRNGAIVWSCLPQFDSEPVFGALLDQDGGEFLVGPAEGGAGVQRLALTWGRPIEEPLAPLCDHFLNETVRHWRRWVKHCDIPPRYQHDVIRSALALKLHCFEDTGAIIAAMTTSIPESPRSG